MFTYTNFEAINHPTNLKYLVRLESYHDCRSRRRRRLLLLTFWVQIWTYFSTFLWLSYTFSHKFNMVIPSRLLRIYASCNYLCSPPARFTVLKNTALFLKRSGKDEIIINKDLWDSWFIQTTIETSTIYYIQKIRNDYFKNSTRSDNLFIKTWNHQFYYLLF
jgi:hypothetical protein